MSAGPNCTSAAQGFRTHFPTIQKTIRHARQLRTVRAPLFPRYIFLILDLGRDRWLSVRSTVGVSSLFTCEGRPVPVPEGIVETLIQNTDEANLTLFSSGLTTGQSVRILSGPFVNFVGTLERLDDAGRVRVLLEMMGTAVPWRFVAPRFVRPHEQAAARRMRVCLSETGQARTLSLDMKRFIDIDRSLNSRFAIYDWHS